VGNEDVREAELRLQVLHQVDDLRLDRDVERADGLVGNHDLRVGRQRAGDADALPLAAGEFVGNGRCSRGESRPLHEPHDAVAAFGRLCFV
jgi:hypothetical protein